jgi:DNA (cytosine-5)-methyltransferase 1
LSLTFLSCFAGIGGADLGFEAAGMRCIGQIEIDPHARAVLTHRFPEVPKHDDITTAITSGWADNLVRLHGRPDVVVGGAPCQDLSVAGKRAGLAGERSGLVLDMVALAKHLGARWIIYENVPGLLTSNGGDDLAYLIQALADAGYPHIEWRVVDSQHYGVPQRRRRVFLAAGAATPRGRAVLVEPEGMSWHPPQGRPAGPDPAGSVEDGAGTGRRRVFAGGVVGDDVAAPLASLTGGPRTSDIESATFIAEVVGVPEPTQPVLGTFTQGGHPGSYNGQDAYNGLLIPVRLPE